MKLKVLERLSLPMPQAGSIEGQLLVKSIIEKVSLTQEEIRKIKGRDVKNDLVCPFCKNLIKEVEPGFFWEDNEYEKDVEFTQEELTILKKQVDQLSSEGQINQQNLSVCLKISNLFPKEKK